MLFRSKFEDWKKVEEDCARFQKVTEENIANYRRQSEPKIKGDWEYTKDEIEQTNLEEGQ